MAALILPRRFYSQPQGLVEVDVGNPLVRGLVDVFNPLSLTNVTSILRYMPSVAAGTITPSAGQMGRSITLPAATLGCGLIVAESADTLFPSSTDATIFVVRRSLDTTARQSSLFGYNGGDANRVSVNGPWSDGKIYFDFGGTALSQRISTTFAKSTNVDYLVFVAGGGKGREIWRNKVKIAGDATKTDPRPSSALNVRIGGVQSINSDSDEIYLFGVVDRAWSDGEIATWFDNPWQIFRAKPRVLYFDVAAGGGITAALTGQSITAAQGSVVAEIATPLSGQGVTAAQGSVTADIAVPLTGQSSTLSNGAMVAAITAPLSGQNLALGQGTVTVDSGGVTAALTGQSASVSLGNVSPVVSVAITGQSVQASLGTMVPAFERAITGQGLTASLGGVVAAISPALSGQQITLSAGSIAIGGNIVRALTGQGIVITNGTVTDAGGRWGSVPPAAGLWTNAAANSDGWVDAASASGTWTNL